MAESSNVVVSLYTKVLGNRSFIRVLFGNFFENKNNTASILAIILVITLCWVIIAKDKYEYLNGLLNVVFVIIGYYFGAKQLKSSDEKED
jgi:hypothetical protein